MSIHGVGIDVADTRRFARLLDRHGERFAARWFTADEIAQCRGGGATALAARYAAKEAVWKALGPEGWSGPLPWRDIQIVDSGGGGTRVSLSGAAGHLAARLGVSHVETSLCPPSHGRHAVAIAVAVERNEAALDSNSAIARNG